MAVESTLTATRAFHQVYHTWASVSLTVVRTTFDLVVVILGTGQDQKKEDVAVYLKLVSLMESEFTRVKAAVLVQ